MLVDMELPQTYKDILSDINNTFNPPIDAGQIAGAPVKISIAGGALRDLYLGREVKDIDVFFQTNSFNDATYRINSIRRMYGYTPLDELVPDDVNEYHEWFHRRGLARQDKFLTPHGTIPVNLVGINREFYQDTFSLLDTFDFGLCKIATIDDKVFVHHHFLMDMISKEFSIYSNPQMDDFEKSFNRWQNYLERYPNYGFRIIQREQELTTLNA